MPMRSELASVTIEPEVAHGLHAGDDAVLHEGIHAPRILGAHVRLEIELADLAAEMRRETAASNRTTGPMPLRPARIDAQPAATSLPTGETIPRPGNDDASFTQRRSSRQWGVRPCPCAN